MEEIKSHFTNVERKKAGPIDFGLMVNSSLGSIDRFGFPHGIIICNHDLI